MDGWIKLHRKIQDHWIYQEKRKFSRYEAWLDMIMMANHKSKKFLHGSELIEVERGQFITSELKLMDRWDWGKNKLRLFLDLLEKDGMIIKKTDRKRTAITICNYGVYHDYETKDGPSADQEQTTDGPSADTNKNVENLKNVNNLINISSSAAENEISILSTYEKIYGYYTMPETFKELVRELKKLGQTDEMIIELFMEAAESSSTPKPSLNFLRAIGKRWVENGITSREQSKMLKQQSQQQAPQKKTVQMSSYRKQEKPDVIQPDTDGQAISEEELEEMIRYAEQMQSSNKREAR